MAARLRSWPPKSWSSGSEPQRGDGRPGHVPVHSHRAPVRRSRAETRRSDLVRSDISALPTRVCSMRGRALLVWSAVTLFVLLLSWALWLLATDDPEGGRHPMGVVMLIAAVVLAVAGFPLLRRSSRT
jgi:hypothetical protein